MLLLGAVLLVGAGTVRWILLPESLPPDVQGRVRAAAWLGVGLVAAFGLLDLHATLRNVLGAVRFETLRDYALSSRHGTSTLLRLVPALVMVGATVLPAKGPVRTLDGTARAVPSAAGGAGDGGTDARKRRSATTGVRAGARAGVTVWGTATVLFLYGVSRVSHASAVPGWAHVPADLLHLTSATAWSGAVLAVAFLPLWTPERKHLLVRATKRVSGIGIVALLVLAATGTYAALLHVGAPSALTTTRYGVALLAKVGLVGMVIGIAAVHRLHFVPSLERTGGRFPFRRLLRLEAILLLIVLAATALLTTSPMPH